MKDRPESQGRMVIGIQASPRNPPHRSTKAAAVPSAHPNANTLEPNPQITVMPSILLDALDRDRPTLEEVIIFPANRGLARRLRTTTITTARANIHLMNAMITIHGTRINLHTTASIPGEDGMGMDPEGKSQ